MNEAIDYNALNWVRQELGAVLKQARTYLEEYAENSDDKASLQECAKNLHQARGPLKMVGLKGADQLAAEMEEVIADLLHATLEQPDVALEILMQAFLQLPDYLSRLHSVNTDAPAALLPVINSLREVRGVAVLGERAVFSPDLTVSVPPMVFTAHMAASDKELQAKARSARTRFQAGLLEWYRGNAGNNGLQELHGVLGQMRENAARESVARLWWAAVAITEAIIAGDIPEENENKQLYGQLDRQIKRQVDVGESVFDDPLTDDLMKRLLYCIARTESSLESIRLVKTTYDLSSLLDDSVADSDETNSLSGCSDELLKTVSATVFEDIERIKDRLDIFTRTGKRDAASLSVVADELHTLGNMLDMIGLSQLGNTIAENELQLRDLIAGSSDVEDAELVTLAHLLIAVEDAVHNLGNGDCLPEDISEDRLFLQEGMQAIAREAMTDMARAKEVIVGYIQSPEAFDMLAEVPVLLSRIRGSLQVSGQGRAAVALGQVELFIAEVLIEKNNPLNDTQLELLADAVSSIEYYIEESGEGRDEGDRVLGIAENSLETLGYACPSLSQHEERDVYEQEAHLLQQAQPEPCVTVGMVVDKPADSLELPVITTLQVIDDNADEEILEIFLEEVDEVLEEIGGLLHAWIASVDVRQPLVDARRGFHTIKGSGRMVGALALAEFAWTFENLLNRIIDGVVEPSDELLELVGLPVEAMSQLLAQVRDSEAVLQADVNTLARKAVLLSQPGSLDEDEPLEAPVPAADVRPQMDEQVLHVSCPVLAEDADPEILKIYLEEAAEEIASITDTMPLWLNQPDNEAMLSTLRRSLHTLKGSGRMAGAMVMGEFSCALENLFNKMVDGSVVASESVLVLTGRVPAALQQLFEQLRDGTAPEMDIDEIVAQSETLCRGEAIEITSIAERVVDEPRDDESPVSENQAVEEDDSENAELREIFINECTEHLLVIEEYLRANQAPCAVTESLYRSLHTISGISNSANVSSICGLAGQLENYFEVIFQGNYLVGTDALAVLHDSMVDISGMIQQLPNMSFDEESRQQLGARIGSLSKTGEAQPVVDPYESMDSELLEVFIEEASEIIDAGEETLRGWAEEPDNQEFMAEFQRQLHTLKGGARMVGITPIGDLSHTLESLLTRVVEGQVEATPDLFTLLHDSHDHLAEMLEHVKSRELPADAGELQSALDGVGMGLDAAADATPVENAVVLPNVEAAPVVPESDVAPAVDDANVPASDVIFGDTSEAEPGVEAELLLEPETVLEAGTELESETQAELESEAEPEPALQTNPDVVSQPADASGMDDVAELPEILPEPVSLRKMNELPPMVERRKSQVSRTEQVRVRADLLDDMVNHAGEISIYHARMEQQISDYRYNLGELDQTIGRLRDQLRQVEMETEAHILFRYEQEGETVEQDFDPLEMDRYSNLQQLSRSLIECIGDLRSIQELMEGTTRESETLLLQQSRVSTDLQEGLLHSRMIPFSGLAPRLRRILRQSARELGKKVDLSLEGADGEMDRTVIERIIAPLEHMLRNAIAHGIEAPATRKQLGKPEQGSVTISFTREGSEIVLLIEDDGAGLDIEAIRARAIERSLLDADAVVSDNDIMQFVLQTGFSTATEVTQISGRGVGMDVVNGKVKQLGGSLHITSTAGVGTVFCVRLPYTLAINQALLVKAGDETFCVPLGSVEGLARFSHEELSACYQSKDRMFEYADNSYQLKHLGSLLGCGGLEQGVQQKRAPVLLVRLGEKRIAFQLESVIGSREIVIKPLGAQLSKIDGVSGATILGDGRVVMILDVMSLSRIQDKPGMPCMTASPRQDVRLHVMVVDDSITVRKVTSRLLQRNSYTVQTAKDGIDALGQLQDTVPDVMLLDIEMPRMDGFELATHMRNDERLKHVPIIMITSRTGDKHRERARQIGVNDYLGKPYQEKQLLEAIQSLIDVNKTEECA